MIKKINHTINTLLIHGLDKNFVEYLIKIMK